MNNKENYSAVYIVSEQACIKKGSGANNHIEVGLRELKKYFNISLFYFFDEKRALPVKPTSNATIINYKVSNVFKGSLKDLWLFYKNHNKIINYYRQVKAKKPSFIYERAAYLNFNGIIIAKLLKIPIFYEINGVFHKDIQVFYKSVLNSIAKYLMFYSYKKADAAFYVGGIDKYLGLDYKNSFSIQNGIDEIILKKFSNVKKSKNIPVKVVFIGHAMKHHGLDFYCKAINKIKEKGKYEFIFIGKGTDEIKGELSDNLNVTFLGEKTEEELSEILFDMDVGVIPSTFEYGSNMKLFMYGAAHLCVIAPDVENLVANFDSSSILFFKKDNIASLSNALDSLLENNLDYSNFGEKLYCQIKEKYTWEKIFMFKKKIISEKLNYSK